MATRKKSQAKPEAARPRAKRQQKATKKPPPNPTRLKEVEPDATQQVPAIDVLGELEERMALDTLTDG